MKRPLLLLPVLLISYLILVLPGCSLGSNYIKEGESFKPTAEKNAIYTLYLIGDAGKTLSDDPEPALISLSSEILKSNPDSTLVVFLGDNIYDHGLASSIISRIPLEQRKTFEALKQMFTDGENVSRDEFGIPANFTTNPQAEVLVFDTIPVKYIRGVNFRSISAMKAWQKLNTYPENMSLVASDTYFKPRRDWPNWQKSQENHNVPPGFDEFEIIDI